MFGPIMRFAVKELLVELAPLRREEVPLFIESGGMQNLEVTKYLGRSSAPVLEDEYEWFDKVRGDNASYCWGVYVIDGTRRSLIGNTSINSINGERMQYGTTGCLIFRPHYWGKGIASHCHRARTWYACTQLGLVQLRSGVFDGNQGSRRALERVGYVPIFHERNQHFVDGTFIGLTSFSLINPLKTQWQLWWHGDPAPEEYRVARRRTQRALEWAKANISFG